MNNYIIIPQDKLSYKKLRNQRLPELREPSYERYVPLSRDTDDDLIEYLLKLNVNALWFRVDSEGAVVKRRTVI